MLRDSSRYRGGMSFARGTTIDPLLTEEDNKVLYEQWDESWGEMLTFQGGSKAITCDMLCDVPLPTLIKVYGKARAERMIQAATSFREV